MKNTSDLLGVLPTNETNQAAIKDLIEQVIVLTEWRNKAIVQLEYFRTACKLYNFCDVNSVNELLNN